MKRYWIVNCSLSPVEVVFCSVEGSNGFEPESSLGLDLELVDESAEIVQRGSVLMEGEVTRCYCCCCSFVLLTHF